MIVLAICAIGAMIWWEIRGKDGQGNDIPKKD